MVVGPGLYDDLCTRAREDADAVAAMVIILGGRGGSGFSVQSSSHVHDKVMQTLPGLLRMMADEIERDLDTRLGPDER
jgi:hypothetical protein